jgi:hypothetical protein
VMVCWVLLNSKMFGLHVWLWRISTLSLYLLSVWLFWRLAWRFARDEVIAFFAAMLYALHPMHVEGVAWLSGAVVEPLLAVFFLGSFLAYLRWRESGGIGWLVACAGLTLSALFSKETAVALPVLIVAHALIFRRFEQDRPIRLAWLTFSMVTTVLLYMAMRVTAIRAVVVGGTPAHSWKEIFLTAPLLFVTYLKHALWPVGLCTWYEIPVVHSPGEVAFYVPLALCLIYVALLIWSLVRKPLAGFMLLWWAVCLVAPIMGLRVFGDNELLHDRFAFVALAGLCVLVAYVLRLLPERGPILFGERATSVAVMAIVLLVLGALTTSLAYSWRSALAMYTRAMEASPRNVRPRILVATELMQQRKGGYALALALDTLRMAPDNWESNYAAGLILADMGDRPRALSVLQHGLDLHPENRHLYLALAEVMVEGQDFAGAINLLQQGKSKSLRPDLLERQIVVIREIQLRQQNSIMHSSQEQRSDH